MSLDELRGRATITVREAGELLGLSKNSAYAAAKRGEIPTLTFGVRRIVVPVPALLRMLGADPPPDGDAPAGTSGEGVEVRDRGDDQGVRLW